MHPALSPLVAATTRWLTRAYPPGGGALQRALAEGQARQAVTLAAVLRYPTELDAGLVALTGAGGTGRLDWITGADTPADPAADPSGEDARDDDLRRDGHEEPPDAWRTWVDEAVASWAACLLGDPELAAAAAGAAGAGAGAPDAYRRLLAPGEHDRRAAALLRHPDLLAPVADLHRAEAARPPRAVVRPPGLRTGPAPPPARHSGDAGAAGRPVRRVTPVSASSPGRPGTPGRSRRPGGPR